MTPAACIVLAVLAGCARPDSPQMAATEVILPGEQKLTPPPPVKAAAAAPAEARPAKTSAPPAATKNAAAPAVAAAAPAPNPTSATPETEPASSTAAAPASGYGTVQGRVVLEGGVPSLPPLLPGGDLRDPNVCVRENIPDYRVIVGPNNGLANVFVFLPRKPAGIKEESAAPPDESIAFDQKTCTFVPHALVVRAGQTIRVLNSDPITHNTNTKPKSNSSFNNSVKPNETQGLPLVYQRAEREPVRVVCDFHTWMLAWHLPLDHPCGAVSAEDGSFTVPGVPAGKHKFAVWHEGKKIGDYAVDVHSDQTTTLDVTVPSAKLAQGMTAPDSTKAIVLSFGGRE